LVKEDVFGWKSRIFITAEQILQQESAAETCLKNRTYLTPATAEGRDVL
jgi:hypothetical protein